jgi:hypothetical protein
VQVYTERLSHPARYIVPVCRYFSDKFLQVLCLKDKPDKLEKNLTSSLYNYYVFKIIQDSDLHII